MKKFRTIVSVVIMVLAAIIGFFSSINLFGVDATGNEAMSGAILFSLIAGIACIVYVIDNRDN